MKLGRVRVLKSHGGSLLRQQGAKTVLEKSDVVNLGFSVQSLGRVSPEVLEQPDEGEREAESKVLARLRKTA